MQTIHSYEKVFDLDRRPMVLKLFDHLGGFDKDLNNDVLRHLDRLGDSNLPIELIWNCIVTPKLAGCYPNFKFKYNNIGREKILDCLQVINTHAPLMFDKFMCCFNGTAHVSRQLLSTALHRFGWFDEKTCSKNFTHNLDQIDGHLKQLTGERQRYFRKFFVHESTQDFLASKFSFGHDRFDHARNIRHLEPVITRCFVQLVSESMATSYYPFVSEKFLYSVVTRGLFLAYAQPHWHSYLTQYYGFKKYDKVFDYRFDEIQNPVDRLIELISMMAKFSILSQNDWRDLYSIEIDTIEYNYEHYFSGNYKKIFKGQVDYV